MSKPRGRAILPGETVSVRLRYAPRCCRMTGTMYRHGLLALPERPCVSQLRVDRWVFASCEAMVGYGTQGYYGNFAFGCFRASRRGYASLPPRGSTSAMTKR